MTWIKGAQCKEIRFPHDCAGEAIDRMHGYYYYYCASVRRGPGLPMP